MASAGRSITSFLFSVYGNDVHTPRALAWIQRARKTVQVSDFTEYELGNALRFAEFSRRVALGEAAVFLAQYEADRAAGRVRVEVCNLAEVLAEARRLSGSYTLTRGHRAFDILHVAAALVLRAEVFLTFDTNQKRLARTVGLKVPV